jgi:hypothetical protein
MHNHLIIRYNKAKQFPFHPIPSIQKQSFFFVRAVEQQKQAKNMTDQCFAITQKGFFKPIFNSSSNHLFQLQKQT